VTSLVVETLLLMPEGFALITDEKCNPKPNYTTTFTQNGFAYLLCCHRKG
jgi:hypothetical protein